MSTIPFRKAPMFVILAVVSIAFPATATAEAPHEGPSAALGVSGGLTGPRGVAGATLSLAARYVELEAGLGARTVKLDCDLATTDPIHQRMRPIGSATLRGLMPFDNHAWHLGAGLASGAKTWCYPRSNWLPGFLPTEGSMHRIDRAYWLSYGIGVRRRLTRSIDIGGDAGFMALLNRKGGQCAVNCEPGQTSTAGGGAFYINVQLRWSLL